MDNAQTIVLDTLAPSALGGLLERSRWLLGAGAAGGGGGGISLLVGAAGGSCKCAKASCASIHVLTLDTGTSSGAPVTACGLATWSTNACK